jgi:hypothetical protein
MYHMRAYSICYHHNSVDLELLHLLHHLISSHLWMRCYWLTPLMLKYGHFISCGLANKTLTFITHYEVCTPHERTISLDHLPFFLLLWDNNWNNKCYSMPKNTQGHRYPRKKWGSLGCTRWNPNHAPHYANIGHSSVLFHAILLVLIFWYGSISLSLSALSFLGWI